MIYEYFITSSPTKTHLLKLTFFFFVERRVLAAKGLGDAARINETGRFARRSERALTRPRRSTPSTAGKIYEIKTILSNWLVDRIIISS